MRSMRSVLLFVVLMMPAMVSAQTFTSFDVPGAGRTVGRAVNNNGTIVGAWSVDPAGPPNHGFLYDGVSFTTFDFPGASRTYPTRINDARQIVGYYVTSAGIVHGFLIDSDGTPSTIDFPGAVSTYGFGINNLGQIVGEWSDAQGTFHGFSLDSGGGFTSFDDPDAAPHTEALAINDSGLICGDYTLGPNVGNGFVYDGTSFTTIAYPGATLTDVIAINNVGVMAGVHSTNFPSDDHGFLYDGTTFTSIDYPGATITEALGLNDGGLVVGVWQDSTGHRHGYVLDLNRSSP